MPLSDYAHWNEDAQYMWWQEEGRHVEEVEPHDDDFGRDDEPAECTSPDECDKWSCFSLPSATGKWECDICGRPAVEQNGRVRAARE